MNTLRLRPAVILVAVMIASFFVVPAISPDWEDWGFLVAVASGLLVLLWWIFLSRAPWAERLGGIVLMGVALVALRPLVHESIRGAGMGFMLYILSVPAFAVGLVVAAVLARRSAPRTRRVAIAAGIAAAASVFLLIRTDGIKGGKSEFRWRWTPTAEQRLLAQAPPEPVAPAPAPAPAPAAAAAPAPGIAPSTEHTAPAPSISSARVLWPGFRGRERNSVIPGVRIETDWARSAPAELWRRPVGPGWSSFAIAGDLIYTQEQRGDHELVSAYRLATGEPVWVHRDAARFYESNGGPGPRATPAVHDGRVYAFGATGILNVLDAATGARIWSRNAAADASKALPGWGFASSPIVAGDLVVVAAAGRVVAYGRDGGAPRWMGPDHGGGYSSPQLLTIAGVPQIVHMAGKGAVSLSPADGSVLWQHPWEGTPIVQPAVTADGDLVLTTADMMGGLGVRRLAVTKDGDGWKIEERWTSRGLKPYFNDSVIHEGHIFGFDGSILSCVDLKDGARKWKGGRYGNGQMILLPDQDLLLVISEDGDLALVSATPEKYTEVAKVPALHAKTWNHPVLVDDVLLVRNGEEMAAYRLARAR